MRGALLGLATMAAGERLDVPDGYSETSTAEFAARSEPLVKISEVGANPAAQDLAERGEEFKRVFAVELQSPITADQLPALDKKLQSFATPHDTIPTDFILQFKLAGFPEKIKNEQDFRQYLATHESWKKIFEKSEDSWLLSVLYEHEHTYQKSPIPKLVVRDKEDFYQLQVETVDDQLRRVEEIEFAGLPHIIHKRDLPRLRSFLLEAVRRGGALNHVDDACTTALLDRYIATLTFDSAEFPTVIHKDDSADSLAAAKQLNQISFYKNGISKSLDIQDGDWVNKDAPVSFGLGHQLLRSSTFEGFNPLDFHHPEQFADTVRILTDLGKSAGSTIYRSSLASHFVDLAETRNFPELNTAGLETYQTFFIEFDNNIDFAWDRDNTRNELIRIIRRQAQLGDITPENLETVLAELARLDAESDVEPELLVSLMAPVAHWRGDLTLSLAAEHKLPGELALQEVEKSPTGKAFFHQFFNYRIPDKISLNGFPMVWTLENITEIEKAIEAVDLLGSQIDIGSSNYRDVKFEGELSQPRTWHDLENLAAILKEHERTGRIIVRHLDYSKFPVFSASYKANILKRGSLVSRWFGPGLVERADFSDCIFAVTPDNLPEIKRQFDYLVDVVGTGEARGYLNKLTFAAFPQEVNEKTEADVAATLKLFINSFQEDLASSYAKTLHSDHLYTFAPIITDENLEHENTKRLLVYYGIGSTPETRYSGIKPKFEVSIPLATTFAEFTAGLAKIGLVQDLDNKVAEELKQKFLSQVDWVGVAKGVDIDNIEAVESVRQNINLAIDAAAGDGLVVEVGIRDIANVPVSWLTMEKKITFAEHYLQAEQYGIDPDVVGVYKMLGSFEVRKILEFFDAEGLAADTGDARVAETIERLQAAGANIPVTEGSWQKAWRSMGDPAYIWSKIENKLAAADVMRPEWQGITPIFETRTERLKAGYTFVNWKNNGEELAKAVIGDPAKGATVDYTVKVGGGLTEQVMHDKYPEGALVAESVGAYTTGAMKPAELTINHGYVVNYLISDRDGLAIVDVNGALNIVNRDKLTRHDLDSKEAADHLAFRDKLEDFSTLLTLARKNEIDVMSGHLLVDNGELAIASNSSNVRDKRRAIATFKDGTFGLIDFSQPMTLYEEAVIAKSMNVKGLVNLDTGYYDHANVYDASGMLFALGQQDQDGTNNKFAFLTGMPMVYQTAQE